MKYLIIVILGLAITRSFAYELDSSTATRCLSPVQGALTATIDASKVTRCARQIAPAPKATDENFFQNRLKFDPGSPDISDTHGKEPL